MANSSKMTAISRATSRGVWSFASVIQVFTAWRTRASQRHALRRLDRHMLRDIGLSEAEAARECARRFWQD